MKPILAILITVTLYLLPICAEATTDGFPPPFALPRLDVKDLHIEFEPSLEIQEPYVVDYNELLMPDDFQKKCVPGRIPTFAFVATISAIGTYTLYGAGAGIVTVGIIYIATDGNRRHTRQAIWGCVTGMVVGGLVKWISVR